MRISALLCAGLIATVANIAQATYEYHLDDGNGEIRLGMLSAADLIFFNRFTAVSGQNLITGVEVAWGMVPNGRTATVAVWQDATGSGDPRDGMGLLRIAPAVVASSDSDSFNTYPIPPVAVHGTFFVGVMIGQLDNTELPARFDQHDLASDSYPSWIAAAAPGTCNLGDISADTMQPLVPVRYTVSYAEQGYWMVRAVAEVPEPTGLGILIAVGIPALLRRRGR